MAGKNPAVHIRLPEQSSLARGKSSGVSNPAPDPRTASQDPTLERNKTAPAMPRKKPK